MRRVSSASSRPVAVSVAAASSTAFSTQHSCGVSSHLHGSKIGSIGILRGIRTESASARSCGGLDTTTTIANDEAISNVITAGSTVRRLIVPPPAPPAPSRFSTYGEEGRQDVCSLNTFVPRATNASAETLSKEADIVGNTEDEDDLDGTMVQGMRRASYGTKQRRDVSQAQSLEGKVSAAALRLPGVGGNSIPMDQLPRPPFEKYGTVLETLRQSIFRLSVKRNNRNSDPNRVNPNSSTIVAVSLGHILNDLTIETRRLLKNPLFCGLEATLRSCPAWFEVSQDSLQARLTGDAHTWGVRRVPDDSVPLPAQIEQAALLDERRRADAARILKLREEEAGKEVQRKLEQRQRLSSGAPLAEAPFAPRKRQKFPNPFVPAEEEGQSATQHSGVEALTGAGNERTEACAQATSTSAPTSSSTNGEIAKKAEDEAPKTFKRRSQFAPSVATTSTPKVSTITFASPPSLSSVEKPNETPTTANSGADEVMSTFGFVPPPPPPVSNTSPPNACTFAQEFAAFGSIPPPPPPGAAPSSSPTVKGVNADGEGEGEFEGEEEGLDAHGEDSEEGQVYSTFVPTNQSTSIAEDFAGFGSIPPPPPPSRPAVGHTGEGSLTSAPATARDSLNSNSNSPANPPSGGKGVFSAEGFKPRFKASIKLVGEEEGKGEKETIGASSASVSSTPPPAAEVIERKPLLVSRSRYSLIGRVKASENIAFERVCREVPSAREMSTMQFVQNGGTMKAVMSKDSKLMGVVDLSIAPLSADEIDKIPALRAHSGLGGPYAPDPKIRKLPPPPPIFPPTMAVPTLPELEFFDAIYGAYSKILPSQMAFALFEFVPTFFVEVRVLLRVIPLNAMSAIFRQERRDRNGRFASPISLFRKYAALFELSGLKSGGSPPAVRINWKEQPYLRRHPRFGMADKHMRRYSLEREGAGVGTTGVISSVYQEDTRPADESLPATSVEKTRAIDSRGYLKEARLHVKIFHILLSHLPRTTDNTKRETFVNLVEWINSFPADDLAVLNEVSQERVIRIIQKYPRIFQLSSTVDDVSLFSPNHAALAKATEERLMGRRISSSSISGAMTAAVGGGVAAHNQGQGTAPAHHKPHSSSEIGEADGAGINAIPEEEENFDLDLDSAGLDDAIAPASLADFNAGDMSTVDGDGDAEASGVDSEERGASTDPEMQKGSETKSVVGTAATEATKEGLGTSSDLPATALDEVVPSAIISSSEAKDEALLGASSLDAIANDAELSEADKGRAKQFTQSLSDGLIGMDDILLGGGGGEGGELLDKGDEAEVYKEDELTSNESEADDSGAGKKVSRQQQQQRHNKGEEDEGLGFSSEISTLLVRRLPRELAARSLCDCDLTTSPNPDLMRTIMNHVPSILHQVTHYDNIQVDKKTKKMLIPAAPNLGANSLMDPNEDGIGSVTRTWRWISLETIYNSLSIVQKRELRPYRGLANFIRMHGRLCEVSEDSRYVIAHDPNEVPPLIPTLRFFSVEERIALPADFDTNLGKSPEALLDDHPDGKLFDRAVGSAQVPTTRVALQVMDPKNPLLNSDVLFEEIANFLPDHPVHFKAMMRRLPPLMKAAVPTHMFRSMQRSKHLTVMSKNGIIYVMRASLGEVQNADVSTSVATLDETLAAVRACVPLQGSTKIYIWGHLSFSPRNYIKRHYENIGGFLQAFPQIFYTENYIVEIEREGRDIVRRMRQVVHLVSNIEAREKERETQTALEANYSTTPQFP